MRQASWNEMFAPRHKPLLMAPEVPQEPRGWRRFLWWEDLLTFGLLSIIFLTVVGSIDRARWVDDMPSLYPIAFFGLLMGAVFARLRWPEGFVHLLALPIGAAAALGQILAVVPGPTPWDRYQALHDRMGDWFHVAFTGGISNDGLPFIVLVVALSWLAAYFSSWAVFRWQNVWLALIPGGFVLLMNVSYLPGQFSFAFVVFLLGGALLVTRLHLTERAKTWRENGTPYPPLLSLSVLHASFWLALVLVITAWLMPQANEADAIESLWHRATTPVTERVEGLSRLFISVRGQKGGLVHRFDDILPFLGSIELPETLVLDVTTEPLDQPRYLRAQIYDIYTPTGWKRRSQQTSILEPNEITGVDERLRRRQTVMIWLTSTGRTGDTIFTIGQPRRINRPVTVRWTRVPEDVTGAVIEADQNSGSRYQAVGSISVATEEELRDAGSDYPGWVRGLYLQLPDDFPTRVRNLAQELTRSQPTPYDQAVAIQSYLRTIAYDLSVPDTPLGRDTIEYFLFDARRGYFDYHASAMVVMLRSVGIPARLAVGYVLQDRKRTAGADRYRVTEQSTFAWPEVYFPGLGWIEFNPTPGQPIVMRAEPQPVLSSEPMDEGAPSGGLGFENLPGLFPEDEAASAGLASGASSDSNRWVLIGIAAGLAAVVAATAGGLRYAWVRGLAGLEPPARLWGQTVRLASWARSPPTPTQTPREYVRTLQAQMPGLDDIDLLTEAYVRYRFGRRPPEEAERAHLEEAWRIVRGRLLRRLLRLR